MNTLSDPELMDERVRTVIALMNGNLTCKLTVDEMAAIVDMSSSHLRRLFRAQTGKSITTYLKDLRLQHSRDLLETTFLSVKEVAARVGQSANHFVTDFKKAHGVTPSHFAARYRRTDKSSRRDRNR